MEIEMVEVDVSGGVESVADEDVDEGVRGEEERRFEDGGVTEDEVGEVGDVASLMFQPTTAIAPTMELWVSVVVAVLQVSDRPTAVDAKVRVIPEDTSDRHSPSTEPSTPFAR